MSNPKIEINEFQNKQLNQDKLDIIYDKHILQAKELINKLLQNTLNASLVKLETNSENQISSLKNTSKYFNEFSKLLSNLSKNVEESKKKKLKEKEKEKKTQAFKRVRKIVTETNLNTRSRTIESTLNNFKNRAINIDGKKNLLKINKKPNLIGHKQGNRTMSSFRNIKEIENDKDTITTQRMQRFKNISFQNTSQNFRKGKNKIIPATPVTKLKEKEKNQLLTKAINSKNFNYRNARNNHSRTIILSHLTDIDEKSEKIENDFEFTKKIKTNNKNVKRIIYKNENRNKVVRINEKKSKAENYRNTIENLNKSSRMKTSDDINKNINININSSVNINTSIDSNINANIEKTNELKNIVKLVDDVNENLNKLLKQDARNNKRRSSLKDMFVKNQSTNALTAIKDVKIKELQNNSSLMTDRKIDYAKNNNTEKEKNEKINIQKSYSLNNFIKKEKTVKKNSNGKLKIFKNIYNNIKKVKTEVLGKSLFKQNKSFTEKKINLKLNEIKIDKVFAISSKNLFEKSNIRKEIKTNLLIKNFEKISNNNINNDIKEKNEIINNIIDKILDKTQEKIEIINKQKNLTLDKENLLNNKTNENEENKQEENQ